MKIGDINYEEMKDLVEFIKGEFEGDSVNTKTLIVLRKFMPTIQGIKLMALMNLIADFTEENYNSFISVSGEELFDKEGKSDPGDKFIGNMNLDMLDMIIAAPLSENTPKSVLKRHDEMVKAKTLEPLFKIKSNGMYFQKKKLSREKIPFIFPEIDELEKVIKGLNLTNNVLEVLLDYLSRKSSTYGELFFNHFSIRLRSCFYDPDEDSRNLEFLENLKKIS